MSDLLSLLFKKEWPWANRSHGSLIWATMSESLLLLFTKEHPWVNRSCCSVKRTTWVNCSWFKQIFLKNEWLALNKSYFIMFLSVLLCFYPFYAQERITQLLFIKEQRNDLLLSLFTKERLWAIHSHCSWHQRDGSDSLFFTSESLFCPQKTSDLLEKPMNEFPALLKILF